MKPETQARIADNRERIRKKLIFQIAVMFQVGHNAAGHDGMNEESIRQAINFVEASERILSATPEELS